MIETSWLKMEDGRFSCSRFRDKRWRNVFDIATQLLVFLFIYLFVYFFVFWTLFLSFLFNAKSNSNEATFWSKAFLLWWTHLLNVFYLSCISFIGLWPWLCRSIEPTWRIVSEEINTRSCSFFILLSGLFFCQTAR